jgi:hypothetical protein
MSTALSTSKKNARRRPRPKKRVPKKAQLQTAQPNRKRTRRQRARNRRADINGSYTNNLFAPPVSYGRTTQRSRGSEGIQVVPGREYLGDVTGSATSAVSTTFYWNPGDSAIFPWLSGIASRYTNWRFRKLRVIYQGTSATTEKGDVIIATIPNFDATLLTTKTHFLDEANMTRAIPWCPSVVHDVLASKASHFLNWFCVSNADGTPASGADYDKYEFGFTQIGCFGNSGSVVVGELWVEYECEFQGRRVASLAATPGTPDVGIDTYSSYGIGIGTFNSLNICGTSFTQHGTRWYDPPTNTTVEWYGAFGSNYGNFFAHNMHPHDPTLYHTFLAYASWEFTTGGSNTPAWLNVEGCTLVANPFGRFGKDGASNSRVSASVLFYVTGGSSHPTIQLAFDPSGYSITNCRVAILDVGVDVTGIARKRATEVKTNGPQLATVVTQLTRPELPTIDVDSKTDDVLCMTPETSRGGWSFF